ncbi:MAG: hypothetical protein WAV72_00405, partial [Bradyrhizobium sp.]
MTQINDSPAGRSTNFPMKGHHPEKPFAGTTMKRLLTIAIVAFAAGMAAPGAAVAQSLPLPTPVVEEVMVKTSLLTFNDANLTGNYAVMYAKMAKPFRDRFTADTLKQAFKV